MTQVTIQMKVYDVDGRRFYMEEIRLPDWMTAEDAKAWVGKACVGLKSEEMSE